MDRLPLSPWYRQHLDEVGESYWRHARVALGLAGHCLVTALLLTVHALLPFCYVRTGGERIQALGRLVEQRKSPEQPNVSR